MSVRFGTRVGNRSWISAGPLLWAAAWIIAAFLIISTVILGLMWPLWAVTEAFPHQVWAVVVGWLVTVAWWLLVIRWLARTKRR